MAQVTAKKIIDASLRRIRVLQSGETPTPDEYADSLDILNDLLGSLSIERLFMPHTVTEQFQLIAGQQTYTFGPGGDFDSQRPISIQSIYTTVADNVDYPCEIIPRKKFLGITYKKSTSTYPYWATYHDLNPLAEISFYPLPSQNAIVTIDSDSQLTEFASVDTQTDLPREYVRFLKYALANELGSEFGKSLNQFDYKSLVDMKKRIKSHNHEPLDVKVFGSQKKYNIYTS